jgi:hypothetical protein
MPEEKVQPHCFVCSKPFRKGELVKTDTMEGQIQHANCFIWKDEFIKDVGTYEEIVEKNPVFKKHFIVN